jgi:hypothetical protein
MTDIKINYKLLHSSNFNRTARGAKVATQLKKRFGKNIRLKYGFLSKVN